MQVTAAGNSLQRDTDQLWVSVQMGTNTGPGPQGAQNQAGAHLNSADKRLKPLYRWLSEDTFFR